MMSIGQVIRKPSRGESGTQLLARLSSHADLPSIDPDVFSKSVSSTSSASLKSSSSGKIIEVYGAEGVGKTEMVLHYIAKVCLPSHWNGYSLNGLGAKVIFIDTEFKFSVMRLAIVLEKQISAILEKLKHKCSEDEHVTLQNGACSSFGDMSADGEIIPASEKLDAVKTKSCTSFKDNNTNMEEHSLSTSSSDFNESRIQQSSNEDCTVNTFVNSSLDQTDSQRGRESKQKQANSGQALAAQDIEDLVQDSLGRVQVMHILSTEQLLISLLSLESNLSNDPLLSLIVIDTISAFFWVDKLEDLKNPLIIDSKMAPIADVISKYVSDFGITFLVIKSALVSHKRMWNQERENSKHQTSSCDSPSISDVMTRKDKSLREHMEFLGNTWSGLSKKRIVLTRSVGGSGRVERAAWCADWLDSREFVCTDDGFQFL